MGMVTPFLPDDEKIPAIREALRHLRDER